MTATQKFQLVDYKVSKPSQYGHGKTYEAQVWADCGAVDQGESLAVKQCNCGALVGWTKSARTGKSYLCQVFRYASNGSRYYYIKASVHTHDVHDRRIADRQAEDARLAQQVADRQAVTESLEDTYEDCVRRMSAEPFTAKRATTLVTWMWSMTA
jgi:hypothetical protein